MKPRHEFKHRINLTDITVIRSRLKNLAYRDEYADKDGGYFVRSLYFDNYMDKALREKVDGTNRREKFRIRYYGRDTSYINLEKKSKINGLCFKEKVRLTEEECRKIIEGDTDFLINSENNLKKELYAKMRYQLLRPKVIVTYRRESFVYPAGNVRVTIDTGISGSYNTGEFLNPDLKTLCLYHTAILEVKWDEYLPQIIKNAVQTGSRKQTAFSKYAAVRF